jgi:hypothetical protein
VRQERPGYGRVQPALLWAWLQHVQDEGMLMRGRYYANEEGSGAMLINGLLKYIFVALVCPFHIQNELLLFS